MPMPRIGSWKYVVAAAIGVTAAGVSGYQYNRVSDFRDRPTWHVFEEEISDANIFSPIVRYAMFKRGSEPYEKDLAQWLGKIELDEAPFDAAVMEGFLSRLDKGQLVRLTGAFASSSKPLLPHIKKKLFPATTGCVFAGVNDNTVWSLVSEDSDEAYEEYSEESIDQDSEESDESALVEESTGDNLAPFDPLTQTSIEYGEYDYAVIPWRIEFEHIEDPELRARIAKCVGSLSSTASKYFPMALVPKQGPEAQKLLQQLIAKGNATLVANVSMSSSEVSKQAMDWLVRNVDSISKDHLTNIHASGIAPEFRRALFSRWIREDQRSRAIATIRQTLLDGHDVVAQDMARPIVDGKDSTLKKDLIVILARNYTRLGQLKVDEAFSGKAPRTEMFYSYDNYFNSNTMARYSQISGHGYVEVGKSFPAIYCMPPSDSEEEDLRKFIASYPWFPATDDAHLRLASRLLLDGRLDEAQAELRSLDAARYVDTDAKELVPDAVQLIEAVRDGRRTVPAAQDWYELNLSERCPSARREDA